MIWSNISSTHRHTETHDRHKRHTDLSASSFALMDWKKVSDSLNILEKCAFQLDDVQRTKLLGTLEVMKTAMNQQKMGRLKRLMMNIFGRWSSTCQITYEIDKLLSSCIVEIDNAPKVALEKNVKDFFSRMYLNSEIELNDKPDGVQLGRIVTITHLSERLTYYVKTHRGGPVNSEKTSLISAKPVQGSEVFVYKFLELMKIGPQVHFFFDSAKDFYIATLDAGYDKNNKESKFVTYHRTREYSFENRDIASYLEEIRTLGESEENCSPSAENMMVEFSKLDLISRFCNLTDVATNFTNFGFVGTRIMIIDFVTGEEPTPERAYKSFLKGNGRNNYGASSDPIIRYAFCTRSLAKRKETALRALQQLGKENLERVVDEARLVSVSLLSELGENLECFDEYVDGVKKTIQRFFTELELVEAE